MRSQHHYDMMLRLKGFTVSLVELQDFEGSNYKLSGKILTIVPTNVILSPMRWVENPIFGIIDPKRHSQKFKEHAKGLGDEELLNRRGRYNHIDRTTLTISGLGLIATAGAAGVLAPPLYCVTGPAVLGIGTIGPLRGSVRMRERKILDKEIKRRDLLQNNSTPSKAK